MEMLAVMMVLPRVLTMALPRVLYHLYWPCNLLLLRRRWRQ